MANKPTVNKKSASRAARLRTSISVVDREVIEALKRIEAETGMSAAQILGLLVRGYTFARVPSKPYKAAKGKASKK